MLTIINQKLIAPFFPCYFTCQFQYGMLAIQILCEQFQILHSVFSSLDQQAECHIRIFRLRNNRCQFILIHIDFYIDIPHTACSISELRNVIPQLQLQCICCSTVIRIVYLLHSIHYLQKFILCDGKFIPVTFSGAAVHYEFFFFCFFYIERLVLIVYYGQDLLRRSVLFFFRGKFTKCRIDRCNPIRSQKIHYVAVFLFFVIVYQQIICKHRDACAELLIIQVCQKIQILPTEK